MIWIQVIGDLLGFIMSCFQNNIQNNIDQSSTTVMLDWLFNTVLINNLFFRFSLFIDYICTSYNDLIKGRLLNI